MSENIISSIAISDIDMDKCYFNPGCAMTTHDVENEQLIYKLLNENFGTVKMHNRCCRHQPNLPEGSVIINNCAGCDRRFRSIYEGIDTISLWEIFDSIDNLDLPNHKGLKVSVQDPCSYRPKPQVHQSVRSLLKKMNIEVEEALCHGTSSVCCGDNFYPKLSIEEVNELQKKRASEMPCENVVVYCVSCLKSMTIGEKQGLHLMDLILNKNSFAGETDLSSYHANLKEYIEESAKF
ncbi:MAG: heterodisulfide reductase-related iron-sulfur binding cluster [Proteocatella sp.]